MLSSLFRIGAFGTVLFSSAAGAMGFGDIVLHSAIGEPLRADVPIFPAPGEMLEGACFSLANIHSADLPVVTSARIHLERHGAQARLTISGRQPITEPIFIIALRAHCGVELQRDYTLMPAPPLQQVNPGLADIDAPVAAGTARTPQLARIPAKNNGKSTASTAADDVPPLRKKKVKSSLPAVTARAPDRIMLGAPPEEAEAKHQPARSPAGSDEARLQKLESTLLQLNQEMDKLNSALALATEALAVQQQLMNAQSRPPSSPEPTALRTAALATLTDGGRGNWLELLLSALLGGGLVAGMAHLLGRRSPQQAPLLPPLPQPPAATPRPPAAPIAAAPPPIIVPAPTAPLPAVDIPLDNRPINPPPEAVTVAYNDSNSALELAEIMLSFGRIRGAAETLAMHIEENAPDNIQPWLMLLDLYRRGDMRSEFESLAGQMQRRFNVRLPTWDDSPTPVSGLKSLEDYAHIVWRCANCWGSQECMDYLYELVLDNRAGSRSGFPLEVIEEIALLMHLLESGYGLRRPGG